MSAQPSVVVHPDAATLAEAVGARLVTAIVDAQAARGTASIVVTGGSTGTAVLAALATSPARDAVRWDRVDVWWGDERFLPAGDPDRNETQARGVLLDVLPLDPARVHVMAASDGPDGDDVAAAAHRYARELSAKAGGGTEVGGAVFDVLMLGVGPDAHVASLFPGLPGVHEHGSSVIAVHDSPKPPPIRLSLTVPALCSARQAWLMTAGADRAEAVRLALSGAAPAEAPAGAVHGREATLWLLDAAAAAGVPDHLLPATED